MPAQAVAFAAFAALVVVAYVDGSPHRKSASIRKLGILLATSVVLAYSVAYEALPVESAVVVASLVVRVLATVALAVVAQVAAASVASVELVVAAALDALAVSLVEAPA